MSGKTTIEWTQRVWNTLRGCKKVSPGCKHCYAERWAERFRGVDGSPFEYGFDVRLVPHVFAEPLRWTQPQLIFVNSMSDLFLEDVPEAFISDVCEVMLSCPWHVFQVLTKRAERMERLLAGPLQDAARASHIWWGVSVEDRRYGLPRVEHLRRTPAAVRFLSVEPLLEDLGPFSLEGIGWLIAGGESGPGARPMQEAWARRLRDACAQAQVPFFFKQWGGVHKGRTGNLLDGRQHLEMPLYRFGAVPTPCERRRLVAAATARGARWGRPDVKRPVPVP